MAAQQRNPSFACSLMFLVLRFQNSNSKDIGLWDLGMKNDRRLPQDPSFSLLATAPAVGRRRAGQGRPKVRCPVGPATDRRTPNSLFNEAQKCP